MGKDNLEILSLGLLNTLLTTDNPVKFQQVKNKNRRIVYLKEMVVFSSSSIDCSRWIWIYIDEVRIRKTRFLGWNVILLDCIPKIRGFKSRVDIEFIEDFTKLCESQVIESRNTGDYMFETDCSGRSFRKNAELHKSFFVLALWWVRLVCE